MKGNAEMSPTSSKNSDCHSTSASCSAMIHRRVRPNSARNELDLVRLPHEDYVFEDVDTVIPGNNSRVVEGGRRQEHEDDYGGISIQGYDIESMHNSAGSGFTREEGDDPKPGNRVTRKIYRWHCYKCPRDEIPSTYNVHYDGPYHGFLYPRNEIDLLDLHSHATTLFPVGRFPGISEIPWTFCCNLLQNHAIVVAPGEPSENDFKDKAVCALFYALELSASNSSFSDESDDCINIKRWIISNSDVGDNVLAISRKAPHEMCDRIQYHLENALAYTSFCDESEAIYDVMKYFASR